MAANEGFRPMRMTSGVHELTLRASDNAMADWISARKGAAEIVYAEGTFGALAYFSSNTEVKAAARYALALSDNGRAACVQRRVGEGRYEYILQRCAPAVLARA